ncbi:polysaccharide pyruvyl transferase family protein [Paeniglutamicibacter antarcticus]|uniref:Polysaccharide pyruvyl transferase family protein n=1 Tax=Arthrobacter terrae TaxID=2935737 RepID=A0A931G836_9MICC|nr:polysaccharide pyruvyl transferase family protein [Arthrobacter terrae]MBG0739889.1 polysaccharide pyruvyl transferase family protein [Arthrobacter terrae]
MKVALLADVGQAVYHVGDEAIAHAAANELRSRGVDELVLLSRDPAQTRDMHGTDSARTIEFPWAPLDRERYLDEIFRVLKGEADVLPADDQAWELLRVIQSCDAVLIAGGGNMNSTYGWLLYERAAVAAVAKHLGKPLVISGQTFGPVLTSKDAATLARLVKSADLVGARELQSHRLALDLGLPEFKLSAGLDDAAFLDSGASVPPSDNDPYIGVSFSAATGGLAEDGFYRAVGAVLDELAEVSGLGIVFIPHMDSAALRNQDLHAHERIAAAMRTKKLTLLEVLPSEEAAAMTAGASIVITSRYHPAVFSTGAGVPAVALSTDHYSDVRLSGALRNWGLGSFSLPLTSLLTGGFRDAVLAAWAHRPEIEAHLRNLRRGRVQESQAWWDAVALALKGQAQPAPPNLSPAAEYAADGSWTTEAEAVREACGPVELRAAVAELELQRERDVCHLLGAGNDSVHSELDKISGSKAFRAASLAWQVTGRLKRARSK